VGVRDHRDAADLIALTSALPKEPRHDERPHRDHQARCRAGHPVDEVSARGPEHRTDQEGELQDVHGTDQEQAAFQRRHPLNFCELPMHELWGAVSDYPSVGLAHPVWDRARA
jgi:hypothetical protein